MARSVSRRKQMKGKHFEKSKPTHNLPQYITPERRNENSIPILPMTSLCTGTRLGMGGKQYSKPSEEINMWLRVPAARRVSFPLRK